MNGKHVLIDNPVLRTVVHVHQKYVTEIDLKIHDVKTGKLLFHMDTENSIVPTADENLRQKGVIFTSTTTGAKTTMTISYEAGNVATVIQEQNGRVDAINTYLPLALVAQSTGLCTQRDAACTTVRGVETDEHERQSGRSGSTRQFITNEQAKIICNEHIDAFFATIHRAAYQRDEHENSTVANVLAGCIADVVLTGEIEAAQAGTSILMIDELTRDATSVSAIQAAVDSGIGEASLLLKDAAKMANARVRRMI